MRILALDWGEIRVGAAVSDESGKIAFPLDKILDAGSAPDKIKLLVNELKVEKILVGLPKTLSGQEGASAKKVEKFVDVLKKATGIPVELVDERFSSVEAGKKLQSGGVNEKKQRTIKDNIAAQILLQQYLDHQ